MISKKMRRWGIEEKKRREEENKRVEKKIKIDNGGSEDKNER